MSPIRLVAILAVSISAAACGDGIDNDGDAKVDYPTDPGCSSAADNDEYNAPPAAVFRSAMVAEIYVDAPDDRVHVGFAAAAVVCTR